MVAYEAPVEIGLSEQIILLVWFSVCGTVPSDAITEDMLLTSLSLGSWGGWSQALLICGGGPVLCTSFF